MDVEYHEGENDHDESFRHWAKGLFAGIALSIVVTSTIGFGTAGAHSSISKEVVRVQGPSLCAEDERLVPVKHHHYNAESVSGWTYTCHPWESKRRMAP